MKRIVFSLILLTILATGCKKQNNNPSEGTITGIWQSVSSQSGIGDGKDKWEKIPNKERSLIYLYEDGSVKGYRNYERYKVVDQRSILLIKPDNSEVQSVYTLVNPKELILSDGLCTDGCAVKYMKVK